MPREVARGFAAATLEVAILEKPLGIVAAALTGETAVSIAESLPSDAGSGYWLRAFADGSAVGRGADRTRRPSGRGGFRSLLASLEPAE